MAFDARPYSTNHSTPVVVSSIPSYVSTFQPRLNKWSKELDDTSVATLVNLRNDDSDSAREASGLVTEFGNGIGLWYPSFDAPEKLKAIAMLTEIALFHDGKINTLPF
jgi:hypothetical protein